MKRSATIFRIIFLIASCVMLSVSSCHKEEIVNTSIYLDKQLNLQLGNTTILTARVSSSVADSLVWTSTDTSLVKVNGGWATAEGQCKATVTAVGLGKTTVIAASTITAGVFATCEVTVSDNVADISLDKRELTLYEGETEVITATLNTTDTLSKKVQWASSADSLVEVSDGKIFAKRAPVSGQSVKITAIVNEDGESFSDSCMVTVKCHVSSITLNKTEVKMQEGETTELKVKVLPERATVRDLDFAVSDSTTISFDKTTGIIKATKASLDPAYIIVTSLDTVAGGVMLKDSCKVTVVKPVSDISIYRGGNKVDDATLLHIINGDAITLEARFDSEDVTNKNVNWTISNENVAKIANAEDTAVTINPEGAGYATIIATSEDGGKTASCLLRVVVPLEKIAIMDDLPFEMYEGEQQRLSIKFEPEKATVDSIIWQSSVEATATVSSNGTVTAVRASDSPVTIAVKAKSYNDKGEVVYLEPKCSTTVKCHPTSVKLNTKSEIMKPGETLQLTAEVQPERAGDKTVTWSPTDSSVAEVDSKGKVTAINVSDQPVYIVVETNDGHLRDSCEIRVVPRSISGITILLDDNKVDSVSVVTGDTKEFTYKLEPEDATYKTVVWESTNTAVATVTDEGVLTAVGGGYTTLKVKSSDESASAWCKVRVTVPLTGISFDKTSLSLYENEQDTINVNFNPADATDKSLTWTSFDDKSVAVMDGRIVALKAGSGPVDITATTADGKIANCSVTVKCHVEAVQVSHKSLTLEKDSTFSLSATVYPERATEKGIIWTSADSTKATVDANGTVTAKTKGTVNISVKSNENGNITDCCELTVIEPAPVPVPVQPESVKLNSTSLSLKVGETSTLVATVSPSDADKSVTWNSGNSSVATVDDSGKVTAVAAGEAVIICKTVNGIQATCTVTVSEDPVGPVDVTSVTLSASSTKVNMGQTLKITATVLPNNATGKSLTWTSSDTNVATVDKSGTVTGVSVGIAEITATSKNGIKGSMTVTVEEAVVPVTGIKLEFDRNDERYNKNTATITLYVGEDFQLNAVVSPSNANQNVIWKVTGSNVKVGDGKLTAVAGMGQYERNAVSVNSVYDPSYTAGLFVYVKARKATGVALDRSAFTMTKDQKEKLHPVFSPVNTTDQSGKWDSDHPDVVSVGADGTVTANAAGQAKITFTSTDGGYKGYCYITVNSSSGVGPGQIQGVGFDDLNGE